MSVLISIAVRQSASRRPSNTPAPGCYAIFWTTE